MSCTLHRLVLVGICFGMVACSSEDEAIAERKLTPEEIAENNRRYEQMRAEEEALKKSIFNASDQVLKQLLADCRRQVNEYADSRNKGPFSNYMIDQYSADVYQYPAGRNALMTDEQRIEDLRKSKDYISFNTEYAILSTSDSFSGPQKSVDKYECEIEKGLKIGRVRKSY